MKNGAFFQSNIFVKNGNLDDKLKEIWMRRQGIADDVNMITNASIIKIDYRLATHSFRWLWNINWLQMVTSGYNGCTLFLWLHINYSIFADKWR